MTVRVLRTLLTHYFGTTPDVPAPWTVWCREVYRRMSTLWFAKMIATTLGITGFLVAYFWVLHNPVFAVTVMPLTALDRAIGYRPQALPIYLSLWFYVSLAPALLKNGREMKTYFLSTFVLSLIGLSLFILWPTSVPKFEIDWAQHASMAFLKDRDLGANACPSMHVAFSVFTAMALESLLREMKTGRLVRLFNWLWCLGILYSTLATLQHVALDVLAGTILGASVGILHLRLFHFHGPEEVLLPSYEVPVNTQAQQ